jgi:hypothetical protein
MAKQLNIFIENRPGRIKAITGLLSKTGINIRALTIQDRGEYGMVKLLVDRPREAHAALSENGFACAFKEVVAVEIQDNPGGLDSFMSILQEHGANIKDAYGFVVYSHDRAVFCVEVQDPTIVKHCAADHGFRLVEDEELYGL